MFLKALFRKYFLITVSIFLFLLFLSFFITFKVTQEDTFEKVRQSSQFHKKEYFKKRRFTLMGSLVVAVFLASGLSLLFLFYSLNKKAKIANQVIKELQEGNLKARLPLSKVDEVGGLTDSFNQMADEIESLVTKLHQDEKLKMEMLQELAHDLRTPLTSMKILNETFIHYSSVLTAEQIQDIKNTNLAEIDYLSRLVDDLLFLAQAEDLKYRNSTKKISLSLLISEQLEVLKKLYPKIQTQLSKSSLIENDPFEMTGNQHLLNRLIRNALDNAFSFAQSQVSIQLTNQNNKNLMIEVIDDGPGLNEESLRNFGQKKSSRSFEQNQNTISTQRVSLGLGSVIMATIIKLYDGEIEIRNQKKGGAWLHLNFRIKQEF